MGHGLGVIMPWAMASWWLAEHLSEVNKWDWDGWNGEMDVKEHQHEDSENATSSATNKYKLLHSYLYLYDMIL